jgi:hypothetical protein
MRVSSISGPIQGTEAVCAHQRSGSRGVGLVTDQPKAILTRTLISLVGLAQAAHVTNISTDFGVSRMNAPNDFGSKCWFCDRP